MKLSGLKIGEMARVQAVETGEDMKRRLRALGVFTGAEVKVLQVGFFARTFLIEADGARLGMGKRLAEKIFVDTAFAGLEAER